ncbi:putative short chain dehydrogenase/ reductase [Aspergillus caelatus]|uniref:Short chain dehydrogenase/ reductase n=2 Tax=Aspergillus subgen. Circumdati TaxID=2720871 RepID=A0ABQ6W8Q0_9EURO|nr:putative short chain dehydrogenase/ reductase [Aspergillus caelatus]KAE8362762.1 putative short chain dehydrogenase/ reductase [Aspergillus caelatus]KAE8413503.1 putative short chain dehydrogenase/ reductase [Aspergillus pseudocaelatus]
MKLDQDLIGKTAFVTGGSGGLGKAISNILAARGAHVTIFARRPGPLADAKNEIVGNCVDAGRQEINAVAVNLADAAAVAEAFRSQPRIADFLYCSAGGNHAENGFFIDLQATQLDSCMQNNYYSTAYAAKAMLDIWVEHDQKSAGIDLSHNTTRPQTRRIVFVNSAAAFLGLPGSVAYTPAKSAVRALADTLRFEVLRHNSAQTTYTVHIAFPADFISPGFVLEQDTKPDLTKRIQGTNVATFAELEEKFPSSEQVAQGIVARVDQGDFIICEDSLSASLLFTNMIGLSPKRGLGIVDSLLSVAMGWFVVPVLRRRWERMCREDGGHKLR